MASETSFCGVCPILHRSESGAAHKLCLSINKNAKRLMLSWLNIRTSATGNPINAVRTVPSGSLRERSGRKRKRSPRAIYQKAPPEIREGFGYSAKVALFRLLSVAFHALTGIKKPAPEVTHSFKVSFAWFFATITT